MARLSPPAPGTKALTAEQAARALGGLSGWEIVSVKGTLQLQKLYKTRHFLEAMDLAQRVTALAEAENHHPQLNINWGELTVCWWTHSLNGLHPNDFIMAAATDAAVAAYARRKPGP